jgi:hypothetical protein
MKQPKSIYQKILEAETKTEIEDVLDKEKSKQIRVHMPAKVVAVNGNSVDVEIQGMEDTGYGYYQTFPLLLDIPIIYNNYTSSAYIITPVQVGDTGLVEFLDFNATNFQNEGNTSLTTDTYYHSLNNGSFINGFIPKNKHMDIPVNKPIVIGLKNQTFTMEVNDSGELVIKSSKDIVLESKTKINLNAPEVKCNKDLKVGSGASGTFVSNTQTITVLNGVIVDIK